MSFSGGDFDLYVQAKQIAFGAITKSILKELEQQGRTTFQQQIGTTGVSIQATLKELRVFDFKQVNPSDRFGGILASFGITLELGITLPGNPNPITESFEISLKDLEIQLMPQQGGVKTGIGVSFTKIDLDIAGLGIFNTPVNAVLDFIALGIRAVLAPLGLIPIPIYQIADVFAKLGISFEQNSPLIGAGQNSDGLVALADFARGSGVNPSDKNAVTDLIPATNPLTVAGQIDQPFGNQIKDIGFGKGYFEKIIHINGITFGLTRFDVSFKDPSPGYRARIEVQADGRGRIKKSWWGSKIFGLSKKKINVYVGFELNVDGHVVPRPTGGSDLKLAFFANVIAAVSVSNTYGLVMSILLGPVAFLLFMVLVQLANIAADKVLPMNLTTYSQNGVNVTITLNKLQISGGLFKVKARAEVGGTGEIDLNQVVNMKIQQYPVKLEFTPDSFQTKEKSLLLGAALSPS